MNSRSKYLVKNVGILTISNFASKILVFLLVSPVGLHLRHLQFERVLSPGKMWRQPAKPRGRHKAVEVDAGLKSHLARLVLDADVSIAALAVSIAVETNLRALVFVFAAVADDVCTVGRDRLAVLVVPGDAVHYGLGHSGRSH